MAITNQIRQQHQALKALHSEARHDFQQVIESPAHQSAGDFRQVWQLRSTRATLVGTSPDLGRVLDRAFGTGPTMLVQVQRRMGTSLAARVGHEGQYLLQVAGGAVNLAVKILLLGGAHVLANLTLGWAFFCVAPTPEQSDLSASLSRVERRIERELDHIANTVGSSFQHANNYLTNALRI